MCWWVTITIALASGEYLFIPICRSGTQTGTRSTCYHLMSYEVIFIKNTGCHKFMSPQSNWLFAHWKNKAWFEKNDCSGTFKIQLFGGYNEIFTNKGYIWIKLSWRVDMWEDHSNIYIFSKTNLSCKGYDTMFQHILIDLIKSIWKLNSHLSSRFNEWLFVKSFVF